MVIRGGSVVSPDGVRRADVAVSGDVVAEVAESHHGAEGRCASLDATGCLVAPAWSICTPISANRAARKPRRSRPAPGRPPSVATPPWWPCRTPSRPSTRPAWPATCWPGAAPPWPRWPWPVPSPGPGRARSMAPIGELAELGVRLFTDDGAGVQDGTLMRRALDYAKGTGRHPGPALRGRVPLGRRGHARRLLVQPAGAARHPGRGRGVDGGPGHPAGPPDRCTAALPAPVHRRLGRAGPPGQGGGTARHRRGGTRTTCC